MSIIPDASASSDQDQTVSGKVTEKWLTELFMGSLSASLMTHLESRHWFPFYPGPDTDPPISCQDLPPQWGDVKTKFQQIKYLENYLGDKGSLQEWVFFLDPDAVTVLFSPPLGLNDSFTLFQAAMVIGERLLNGPEFGALKAPTLFAAAIAKGVIDPRHPDTLEKLSDLATQYHDPPFPVVADLEWCLFADEIQAFTMTKWGRPVFTEAELKGEGTPQASTARSPEGKKSRSTPDMDKTLGALEMRSAAKLIATLASMDRLEFDRHAIGKIKTKMEQRPLLKLDEETISKFLSAAKEVIQEDAKPN